MHVHRGFNVGGSSKGSSMGRGRNKQAPSSLLVRLQRQFNKRSNQVIPAGQTADGSREGEAGSGSPSPNQSRRTSRDNSPQSARWAMIADANMTEQQLLVKQPVHFNTHSTQNHTHTLSHTQKHTHNTLTHSYNTYTHRGRMRRIGSAPPGRSRAPPAQVCCVCVLVCVRVCA